MRTRQKLQALKKIADIRSVQCDAAEMQLWRASLALVQLDQLRHKSLERLQSEQAHWVEVVSGPSMRLHLVETCLAAVSNGNAELNQIDSNIQEAQGYKARQAHEWMQARMRADIAKDMASSALKRFRRLRDESRMNEVADRMAHQHTSQ